MVSIARIWSIFSMPIGALASSTVTSSPAFLKISTKTFTGAKHPKSTAVPAQSKMIPSTLFILSPLSYIFLRSCLVPRYLLHGFRQYCRSGMYLCQSAFRGKLHSPSLYEIIEVPKIKGFSWKKESCNDRRLFIR